MSKPPRLTVLTSQKYWIEPFLPFFESAFRVRFLYFPPLPLPGSLPDMLRLIATALSRRIKRFHGLKRADIIFVEWANDHLAVASRLAGRRKLVARLHRYEIFHLPDRTDWSRVDALVVVIDAIGRLLEQKVPELRGRVQTIHNYMDLSCWRDRRARPLTHRLGIVGHLVSRKGLLELITLFKELHARRPELTLHIAGKEPSREYRHLLKHQITQLGLTECVFIQGFVADLGAFYRSLDIILSFSHHESTQLTLFEGLACGALPLSFHWEGVEEFLPAGNLFADYAAFKERIDDFYELGPTQRDQWVTQLQERVLPAFTRPDPRRLLLELLQDQVKGA